MKTKQPIPKTIANELLTINEERIKHEVDAIYETIDGAVLSIICNMSLPDSYDILSDRNEALVQDLVTKAILACLKARL